MLTAKARAPRSSSAPGRRHRDSGSTAASGVSGLIGQTGRGPPSACNSLEQRPRIVDRLDVKRDRVGAGRHKLLEVSAGLGNHQMHFDRQRGHAAHGLDDRQCRRSGSARSARPSRPGATPSRRRLPSCATSSARCPKSHNSSDGTTTGTLAAQRQEIAIGDRSERAYLPREWTHQCAKSMEELPASWMSIATRHA